MTQGPLLVAIAVVGALLSLAPAADADCAAPNFTVRPKRVAAGDDLRISGHSWGDACNDTPGPGCDPPPLGNAAQDVDVILQNEKGKEVAHLGTVDADDEYGFELSARIPGQLPSGIYAVTDRDGRSDPARVRIAGWEEL